MNTLTSNADRFRPESADDGKVYTFSASEIRLMLGISGQRLSAIIRLLQLTPLRSGPNGPEWDYKAFNAVVGFLKAQPDYRPVRARRAKARRTQKI